MRALFLIVVSEDPLNLMDSNKVCKRRFVKADKEDNYLEA